MTESSFCVSIRCVASCEEVVHALGPSASSLTSFNRAVEILFVVAESSSISIARISVRVLLRARQHPRLRLKIALRRGMRDLPGVDGSVVDSKVPLMIRMEPSSR